ncbi:hypothetical protein ACFS5L_36310 [Streptomyces phyllanthi]|uniref:Uncharacterized protein n=1 Tax=Streptomyces phyllanthi TaxID=1803180 RepID=A0A5N8WA96_9ACTN|nr:hypothetical protein [Streptomyces phyllanthi]MPY43348.1 hypothetical protein [Streptomyces phyllanthi]
MGRADETSRYDAAAETRQFTDQETRQFRIPEPRSFGQVAETRHPGRGAETQPFGQVPDAGRRGAGTPGTREPGKDQETYQSTHDVPWEETGEPGHTHDPHEVTVQMDGVGRQLEDWLVQQAKSGPVQQDSDGPVFVDESGRRRSRLRRFGILVGLACAVYAVVIAATLMSGTSEAPWLPGLGEGDKPAGQVETSPRPTDSADPSEAASGSPSAGASAGESASATPGAGASADPSAGVAVPGASTTPDSSAGDDPGGDPTPEDPDTDPAPTTPSVTTPSTDPEPSTSESSDSDGTGTGTGPDTAADGTGTDDSDTVASGATPRSSSPENTV